MIEKYVAAGCFDVDGDRPWISVAELDSALREMIAGLDDDYVVWDGVAVHKSAEVGHNVTIKAPAIIGPDCFIGANSFLRNGVFMARGARVGISCEIKTTIMFENSAVAHFNFVGDSIIGRDVNIEAGAIVANHYNEREDKTVFVHHEGRRINTGLKKFGAIIGDGCRIGANAVLSPGTLLKPNTVVRRLQLIEQDHEAE